MLLDLGKAVSFILSILSLYPVMLSAFFVPGSRWQDRLVLSLFKIALAACICFASGFLFAFRPQARPRIAQPITTTLPVQIFFWAMVAMAILFVVSWYLEEYYVPLLWRNQP
jgi:cation transport ATPase